MSSHLTVSVSRPFAVWYGELTLTLYIGGVEYKHQAIHEQLVTAKMIESYLSKNLKANLDEKVNMAFVLLELKKLCGYIDRCDDSQQDYYWNTVKTTILKAIIKNKVETISYEYICDSN